MGSVVCSRTQQPTSMEMGVLPVKSSDKLRLGQNRLEINWHTPQEFDANCSSDADRLHGNQPQIEFPNKTDCSEAQSGMKQTASYIRQDPPDTRVLYPAANRLRKEGGNNKMSIDPCSSKTKKQLMNLPAANVDCDITTVLERLMASEDEEIKALAKRLLFAKAVLPVASPGERNLRKHGRARSLTSLKQLRTPNFGYPVYGHIDTACKKTQPQPDRNINDNHVLDSSPPSLHFVDEKQSNTKFQLLSNPPYLSRDRGSEKSITEQQDEHEIQEVIEYSKLHLEKTRRQTARFSEELKNMRSLSETLNTISLTKRGILRRSSETPNKSIFLITESSVEEDEEMVQSSENDFFNLHEEELGMISRDIDEFEQKINETRIEIRLLRRESVNMLTNQMSDSEKHSDTDKEGLSFLEIEQKISQLEDESHELEIQRREALSSLQNKMLGNILGSVRKELLPLLPVPLPEKLSAPMCLNSQTPSPSFEVRASNCCQFSRLSKSSEGEASDVEGPSTQREDLYHTKEEKPNEN